jgi:hypothetical protein
MNACCSSVSPAAPVAIGAGPVPAAPRRWWSALRAVLRPAPEPPAGIGDLDARMLRDIGWCRESLPMPRTGAAVRREPDFS